jgi:hypothetical protein
MTGKPWHGRTRLAFGLASFVSIAASVIAIALAVIHGQLVYATLLAAAFAAFISVAERSAVAQIAAQVVLLTVGIYGIATGLFWYALAGALAVFAVESVRALVGTRIDLSNGPRPDGA